MNLSGGKSFEEATLFGRQVYSFPMVFIFRSEIEMQGERRQRAPITELNFEEASSLYMELLRTILDLIGM